MNDNTNNEYMLFKERVQKMIDDKLESTCIDYIEEKDGNKNYEIN